MARPELAAGTRGALGFTTLKNGNIQALVYYRDAHGVRKKMKASARTKTEAKERLDYKWDNQDLSDADAEIVGSTTIKELSDFWLRSLRGKSSGTMRTYSNRIRISITPYIGEKRIKDVSTGYLETHLRRIADGGEMKVIVSKSASRNVPIGGLSAERTARIVLRAMFDLAVSYDAVPSRVNPVAKDKRSGERRALRVPIRALTKPEYLELQRRIAAWQGAQQYGPRRGRDLLPALDVMLGTGVRTAELLAVLWEDLDLYADIPFILVTGTITTDDHGRLYRQDWTKGDENHVKKIQPIALPRYIVDLLKDRKAATESASGLVFPDRNGGIMSPSNFRRGLGKARRFDNQTGDDFHWVTPKSMRKSAATMIKRSSGLEAAAAQLRHSSSETTRRYYTEVDLEMVDNRAVFDDIFPDGRVV